MSGQESLDITARSSASSQPQAPSTDAPARPDDRVYGLLLGLAMVGGEIVWLCALAYLLYRLLP